MSAVERNVVPGTPSMGAMFSALRRRGVLMICALLLCPAIAYGITTQMQTEYQAQVLIQVRVSAALEVNGVGLPQLLTTAQVLAGTPTTRSAAGRLIAHGRRLGTVTATTNATTGFVVLAGQAQNAEDAAATANAFAQATVTALNAQSEADARAGIVALSQQIADLPPGRSVLKEQLEDQLAQLSAQDASGLRATQITAPAEVPTSPSSPQRVRAILLGGLIGLLLAIGLGVLAEWLDRRFHSVQQVEGVAGAPVLSTIPPSAFKAQSGTHYAEVAFARLRSSLATAETEVPNTLLVASGGVAEGKTTVSINLALSFARAGARVVLLETDLRRPMVARRLGLKETVALSTVLDDFTLLPEALQPVTVDLAGATGSLDVLPCGELPLNPAELIASPEMRALLKVLRDGWDVVVIDSSPLLAVPDPMPLLRLADVVLLVVRLDKTRTDRFARSAGLIAAQDGRLAGLVVTGVRAGDPYYARAHRGYYVDRPRSTDQPLRPERAKVESVPAGGFAADTAVATEERPERPGHPTVPAIQPEETQTSLREPEPESGPESEPKPEPGSVPVAPAEDELKGLSVSDLSAWRRGWMETPDD